MECCFLRQECRKGSHEHNLRYQRLEIPARNPSGAMKLNLKGRLKISVWEKLNKKVLMSKKESRGSDGEIENQLRAGEGMVWTLWPWTMVFWPPLRRLLDLILCFCFLSLRFFGKQLLLTLCSQALVLVLSPHIQGIKHLIKIIKLIPLKYLFSIR